MVCLDTTALIDLTREKPTENSRRLHVLLRSVIQNGARLTTTRLNIAEMYVGLARSTRPKREQLRIDRILAEVLVLEFVEQAAPVFGRLMAAFYAKGRPVGDMDALIASVAIVNDVALVTRNIKHFDDISDLVVIDY